MRERELRIRPWHIVAIIVSVVSAVPLVWAAVGDPAVIDDDVGTVFPEQLGKNPAPGAVLQMPTGTDQRGAYWRTIKTLPEGAVPGDVPQVIVTGSGTGTGTEWGVTNITGTLNHLTKKTAGGWGDSLAYQDDVKFFFPLELNTGPNYGYLKLSVYDDGSYNKSGIGVFSGEPLRFQVPTGLQLFTWGHAAYDGSGYAEEMRLSAGTLTIAGGLAVKTLPGGGVNKFLYQSSTDGTISAKTITAADVGAQPSVPGSSGQIPKYTATGTSTGIVAANGTIDFDPLGTYFLHTSEGPVFYRWGTFSPSTAATSSAVCSTGSDGLIAEFFAGETSDYENRMLWPGGAWLAKLNAKVNANGAAIRVEVWDTDGSGGYAQWFNWTTDTFTNTTFAVTQKLATSSERAVASRSHRVFFRLYATCSTSTTVTLQYADGSSRIESPIAKEAAPTIADVDGLSALLAEKEPLLQAGKPGQAVGYLGTGTATGTTKGPIDLEAITSGTPGQFVKFLGTGTNTTTSKGGVSVTIPTPVTTRSFTVAASSLNLGSGAVAGNLSSNIAIWTLRNAQSDYAYGAVITVPNDYSSGLAVSPLWYPISADSTTTHKVKWAVGHMAMPDAAGFTLTFTSWTGKECGSACSATYVLVAETAFGFGSYSAGDVVAVGIKRLGSDAADTYTGDLALAGLKFTYTSSL